MVNYPRTKILLPANARLDRLLSSLAPLLTGHFNPSAAVCAGVLISVTIEQRQLVLERLLWIGSSVLKIPSWLGTVSGLIARSNLTGSLGNSLTELRHKWVKSNNLTPSLPDLGWTCGRLMLRIALANPTDTYRATLTRWIPRPRKHLPPQR
jgi:hypothetical protein